MMTEEAEECFQLPLQEMSYKRKGGTQGKQSFFYEARTLRSGEKTWQGDIFSKTETFLREENRALGK